jgi:hypothetical protein
MAYAWSSRVRERIAGVVVLAVVGGLLAGTPVAAAAEPVRIDAVTPPVAAAGSPLVVTGSGFAGTAGDNVVRLNGRAATVTAASPTRLDVTVPAGGTSGPVTVQTPDGSATSPSDVFVPPAPFGVADVESTQRLAYGTAATAAVATAGRVALLSVAGRTGQRLAIRLATSTFGGSSSVRVAVYRPDGTALVGPTGFGSAGTFLEPPPLPADGTYTVLIDPQGSATGQVVVTTFDVPADAVTTATPGGEAVTATVDVPGRNAAVTFTGTAGQRAFLTFSGGTFGAASNARVSVRNPDGTTLLAAVNCGTSCRFDTTVLPATGTYTVVVDPQAAAVGAIDVRAYAVPADATATAVPGGPAVTVATSVPGQNALVTFAGAAGQRIYLAFTGGTYGSVTNAEVSVRRPDGTGLVGAVSCGTSCALDTRTLPAAGTYTVFVDPQAAAVGALTVRVHDVPPDVTASAVTDGTARTVTTTVPGQNAAVPFTGTADQRIFFAFSGGTFGSLSSAVVTVRKPDGTALLAGISCGTACTIDTRVLPATGTYTVVVDPQGAAVGELTARLHDVPADAVVPATVGGPAVALATTVPGQNGRVTFDAATGTSVSVQVSGSTYGSGSGSATVSVLRPDGTTLVAGTGLGGGGLLLGPLGITTAGTYTVVVNPQGGGVGGVNVRAYSVNDTVVATTVGAPPVTVTTATPGQNASVTFPGVTGQRIAVALTGSTYGPSSTSLSASLLKPDGTVLVAATGVGGGAFLDALDLPADGIYTVLLNPAASLSGSVHVEVVAVPADAAATVALDGTTTSVATTVPGQNAVVSFAGTAGRRVSLRLTDGVGRPYVTVRAPDGSAVKARWYVGSGDFVEPLSLPATGTYRILVDPGGSALGSLDVRAWDVPADAAAAAVAGGSAVTVAVAVPGQNAVVSVDGSAGQRISVRFGTAALAYATIRKPDGTDLRSRWNIGSGDFADPMTLPVAGTYTILVDPVDSGTGAVEVQVHLVPADVTLPAAVDGTAVVVATTVPGQNAVVTFPGTAGQRLGIRITAVTAGVHLSVRKPDGTDLRARTYVSSATLLEPVALPADGVYTLHVDPAGANVGTVTAQLYDVPADATVAAALDGTPVRVNLTVPGQNGRVTFAGVAGRRAFAVVDAVGGFAAGSVAVTLRTPAGTSIGSSTLHGTGGQATVGPADVGAGTFAVELNPAGLAVGALTVTVYDATPPAAVPATPDGPAVQVRTTTPGQSASVGFTGTAGQRVSVRASDATFASGTTTNAYSLALVAPDGTTLRTGTSSGTAAWLLAATTLPATGAYSLRVDPVGPAVGSATVQIFAVPADVSVDTTVGGGHVPLDLPVPGMSATLSFPADAGQPLTLGLPRGPWPLSAVFRDPSGATLCTRTLAVADTVACTAGAAGTHRITVTNPGPHTGTWTVELFDGLGTPAVTVPAPDGWWNEHAVTASWTTPATVPVAGYAVVVDGSPGTVPGTTVTQTAASLQIDLPDGVHHLHVRAVSAAGYAGPTAHQVIRVDTVAPAVAAISVPSHPDPDAAVSALAVTASFTAAADASGVTGYAVSVTRGADDVPWATPTPGTTFTATLTGQGVWYLHVVAVDAAGNRGTPAHRRLTVDTPPSPAVISSVTHPVPGTAYPGRDLVATWTAQPSWASTWAAVLDQQPDTVPPATTATSVEARYAAHLTPGTWYLHVRGVDSGGAWGPATHFRVVVAPAVDAFVEPLAGRTVWGAVPVVLTCPGRVTVQARPDGGQWRAVGAATPAGDGTCTTSWQTAGATPAWADGRYDLRALDGDTVVAHLPRVVLRNAADVLGRLTADYEAGQLDVTAYVRYALYAAVSPGDVPERYTGGTVTEVDHADAMAVVNGLWSALPVAVQTELAAWLTPTVLDAPAGTAAPKRGTRALADADCGWQVRLKNLTFGCVATTAHFTVYYVEGQVGPTSAGNSRPDFVQKMLDALEEARTVYGDRMGYRLPEHLNVALDPTMPSGAGLAMPAVPGCLGLCDRPAMMYMSDDWDVVTPYLPRHELFHFAQYEYLNDLFFANSWINWWMEATAEWAVHRAEFWTGDAYGGYFGHLDDFLAESAERFDEGNSVALAGGPEYGAFLVAEYLEERLDADAIRQSWERLGGWAPPPPGEVVLELLRERRAEHSTAVELEKFRQWAYVLEANGTETGFVDVDAASWRAAVRLPGSRAPHDTVTVDDTGTGVQHAEGGFDIQQSGAHYVEIANPDRFATRLTVSYDADDEDVLASVLRLDPDGRTAPACGGPQRVAGEAGLLLDAACPRALLTVVNAEAPGAWGTWSKGSYTVSYERQSVRLGNGVVELGMGRYGTIDDPDGVGLRLANRPDTESVLNGCWCEGWGVGTSGGVGGSVTTAEGAWNLTLESFSVTGGTATSVVRGPVGLTVVQTTSPSTSSHLYELRVVVLNEGDGPLAPVRYRRVVDWDPLPNLYLSYNTFQTLGGDTGYITGVTNDGFADPDPSRPLTDLGATGWFTDFGPDDTGALVEIDLGTIEPGASRSFSLYYGTAPDEAAAVAAARSVGAQAYSLGQVNTDDGRNLGVPYTGVLAVDGALLDGARDGNRAMFGPVAPTRQFAPSIPGRRPVQG